jgi:hypothetical protein
MVGMVAAVFSTERRPLRHRFLPPVVGVEDGIVTLLLPSALG